MRSSAIEGSIMRQFGTISRLMNKYKEDGYLADSFNKQAKKSTRIRSQAQRKASPKPKIIKSQKSSKQPNPPKFSQAPKISESQKPSRPPKNIPKKLASPPSSSQTSQPFKVSKPVLNQIPKSPPQPSQNFTQASEKPEGPSKNFNFLKKPIRTKFGEKLDSQPRLDSKKAMLDSYFNQEIINFDEQKVVEDAVKRIMRQHESANRMVNPLGGKTGPSLELKGSEEDYEHPVIGKPKTLMERVLVSNFKSERDEYVRMVGNIENIDKVNPKKVDPKLSVPSEGDTLVRYRSKKLKEKFLSSDEEDCSDDLDLIGNKRVEDNEFIQVIKRKRGIRVNYNMIHPRDKNKHQLFKFYITNQDYDRMSQLIQSHRDILIFIDGSSRGNPGRAGAGISFFGRKANDFVPEIDSHNQIIDITDNSGTDNIFDILANERKVEIFRESKERERARIKAQSQVNTVEDELEEREFMFGACFNLGRGTNNYAEYSAFLFTLILNSLLQKKHIIVYSDSTLVVDQVKGNIQTRHPVLKEVLKQAHELALSFEEIEFNYIERELNTAADSFAREASSMSEEYKFIYSLQEVVSAIKLS
ncbi:unnamed protein product [Moneuplotes crassus]|uniref:RNase H type-1 domain-containing protein n=1 Tax=Euplotes crassus TaxID=5936 RepID=A0AAD1X934_EUPCR|nr:unnamed protein product [Moneuplotes crassus]